VSTPDTTSTTVTTPGPSRHTYGAVVAGIVLVVVGALWLLHATDVIELDFGILVPAILAVIGIALIIGSFDGAHTGLVIAGVFLTILTLALAVAPAGAFRGGVGERNIMVGQQSELADRYDLGLGEMSLDLSELDLTSSAEIAVSVGAGQINIILPEDLEVDIDASAWAGQIDLLGERAEGLSVTLDYTSDGFDTAPVTLTLDVNVAAGDIKVER
jgi:predicted membrane protein